MTANTSTSDAFITAVENLENTIDVFWKFNRNQSNSKAAQQLRSLIDGRLDAVIQAPRQSTDFKVLLNWVSRAQDVYTKFEKYHPAPRGRNGKADEQYRQLDDLIEAIVSDLVSSLERPTEQVSHWQPTAAEIMH
ncbi:MAG: hypothetical protein LQ352_006292 [Teloschistes flavicans]|nr:MAG: hypothetical protein LQ352_006292 [Teloschistes flavicans]